MEVLQIQKQSIPEPLVTGKLSKGWKFKVLGIRENDIFAVPKPAVDVTKITGSEKDRFNNSPEIKKITLDGSTISFDVKFHCTGNYKVQITFGGGELAVDVFVQPSSYSTQKRAKRGPDTDATTLQMSNFFYSNSNNQLLTTTTTSTATTTSNNTTTATANTNAIPPTVPKVTELRPKEVAPNIEEAILFGENLPKSNVSINVYCTDVGAKTNPINCNIFKSGSEYIYFTVPKLSDFGIAYCREQIPAFANSCHGTNKITIEYPQMFVYVPYPVLEIRNVINISNSSSGSNNNANTNANNNSFGYQNQNQGGNGGKQQQFQFHNYIPSNNYSKEQIQGLKDFRSVNTNGGAQHEFAAMNNIKMVKLMMALGSSVNMVDKYNITIAHIAAFFDYSELLEYILSLNPNLTIKDCNGDTPIDIAREEAPHLLKIMKRPFITTTLTSIIYTELINIAEQIVSLKELKNIKRRNVQEEISNGASCKIFVGGLGFNSSVVGLRDYFIKYGNVKEVIIMIDKVTSMQRGFGFILFESSDSIEKILRDGSRHFVEGKQVEVKRALSKSPQTLPTQITTQPTGGDLKKLKVESTQSPLSTPRESSPSIERKSTPASTRLPSVVKLSVNKIFVSGISSKTSDAEFSKYFNNFGTVINSHIVKDFHGRSRGFGFVEFESEDDANKLIAEKFLILNSTVILVKKYDPQLQKHSYVYPPQKNYYYPNRISNFPVYKTDVYSSQNKYPRYFPVDYLSLLSGVEKSTQDKSSDQYQQLTSIQTSSSIRYFSPDVGDTDRQVYLSGTNLLSNSVNTSHEELSEIFSQLSMSNDKKTLPTNQFEN